MEMRGCQAELVSTVNAAKVVDTLFDDVVSRLNGNGVEKPAAWTGAGPEVDEGEIDENPKPDFNGESGTPEISFGFETGELFGGIRVLGLSMLRGAGIVSQRREGG